MFIYVFKEADRDKLLRIGFAMIHADDSAKMWVFLNNPSFSAKIGDDMERVISSKLVFTGRPDQ